MATKWLLSGEHILHGAMDKKMMHVLGKGEQNGTRFHHDTQNNTQFKTYELFMSVIFYLTFSDCSWLQVTETMESETADKGGEPLYMALSRYSIMCCFYYFQSVFWAMSNMQRGDDHLFICLLTLLRPLDGGKLPTAFRFGTIVVLIKQSSR